MDYVSADASQGDFDHASGHWTIGALAAGESVTLTVVEAITGSDPSNTAGITHSDTPDPASDNDTSTVTLIVAVPPVSSGHGELPTTGSDVQALAGTGLLLLVAGAGALVISRRRHRA
jgi:LPXTG-motif cell wall-anchored protein